MHVATNNEFIERNVITLERNNSRTIMILRKPLLVFDSQVAVVVNFVREKED